MKTYLFLRKMTTVAGPPPLTFSVISECSTTKARVGVMNLRHSEVETPVFMPVGTQVLASIYFLLFSAYYTIIIFTGNNERNPTRSAAQHSVQTDFSKYLSLGNASCMTFFFCINLLRPNKLISIHISGH